jgi:hypothetical protein
MLKKFLELRLRLLVFDTLKCIKSTCYRQSVGLCFCNVYIDCDIKGTSMR